MTLTNRKPTVRLGDARRLTRGGAPVGLPEMDGSRIFTA